MKSSTADIVIKLTVCGVVAPFIFKITGGGGSEVLRVNLLFIIFNMLSTA